MENFINPFPKDFSNRLNELIILTGISVHAFEKEIGVSVGAIYKPIENKKTIGAEAISKILLKFPDFDIQYLLTGNKSNFLFNSQKQYQLQKIHTSQVAEPTPEYKSAKEPESKLLLEKIESLIEEKIILKIKLQELREKLKEEPAYQELQLV